MSPWTPPSSRRFSVKNPHASLCHGSFSTKSPACFGCVLINAGLSPPLRGQPFAGCACAISSADGACIGPAACGLLCLVAPHDLFERLPLVAALERFLHHVPLPVVRIPLRIAVVALVADQLVVAVVGIRIHAVSQRLARQVPVPVVRVAVSVVFVDSGKSLYFKMF